MTNSELETLCWPVSRLGEAMRAVARHCHLSICNQDRGQEISGPPAALRLDQSIALIARPEWNEWVETAADFLGFEAEAIEAPYSEVEKLVRGAGPALLLLPEGGILAVIKSDARRATIIDPDFTLHRAPVATICSVLRRPHEAKAEGEVDRLLAEVGTPSRWRARARTAILREQLGPRRISGGWLLRMPPGVNFWRQLRAAGLTRSLAVTFGLRLIHYALLVTAWWVLGRAALSGQLNQDQFARYGYLGLPIAWGMLLLTAVPFHLLAEWRQGRFVIEAGARLKERLLFGLLRLQPEEIRHLGLGQMLGKMYESHAIESLAFNGGLAALSAVIEMVLTTVILIGNGSHRLWSQLLLFLSCVALTSLLAWRYYRHCFGWTEMRAAMTNDLVERMVGHRTRLAQESREDWHEGEDRALESYLTQSQAMDRAGIFQTMVPRGWLAVGLCGLTITVVDGGGDTATIAISVGGLLLGYRGLQKLATSLSSLSGAALAWKQIAGIFKAGARRPENGLPDFAAGLIKSARPETLVEAHDLTFRYHERGEPVLRACELRIRAGDRLLLEGGSGDGKSTLASLLTGLRVPESGLLLLDGLDRQTIGAASWGKRVASAPQFHENHVLTGTFAFNLLMGRGWPPSDGDLNEAEEVCRALGLGELLSRMPAGLLQMVGESGWQLSHGERSRMFMARALLQGADLVILDESFGALDPATLRRCLQTALDRAKTLLVVAHP
ncbi:MAG TPA: ABC transporter ATP-binding protein [Blastocatellia bacterium]|nr:ABC transporter ATP-binding protein [Blastocatellia bacterium]